MTLPYDRSWPATLSTRAGLVLLAPLSLLAHLVVGVAYAVHTWGGKLRDAWRAA